MYNQAQWSTYLKVHIVTYNASPMKCSGVDSLQIPQIVHVPLFVLFNNGVFTVAALSPLPSIDLETVRKEGEISILWLELWETHHNLKGC